MNQSAEVHRVLARCLVDPVFLQSIEDDGPAVLAGYDLDESVVRDFKIIARQMAKYAGLIATVQNNGLWQHIPATRRLLKRYRLDLKTFVAYRTQHQANRAGRGLTRDALTATFFSFFEDLLAEDPAFQRAFLRDVFVHERSVWEMQRMAEINPRGDQSVAVAVEPAGPVINGCLRLIHYDFDPITAVERILANAAEIGEPNAMAIGYWRDPSDETLRLIALTPMAADLLSRADGRITLPALVAAAGETYGADPAEVLAFLERSIALGLLSAPATNPTQPTSAA